MGTLTKYKNGEHPTDYMKIMGMRGNNYTQRLDGTYAMDNPEYKSRYNCEKYKPLLDVDFNISHLCCREMKKKLVHKYQRIGKKHPIIATMTEESLNRQSAWLKNGCNSFDGREPMSKPMSFWREEDVLQYIKQNNLPIASVYGEIVDVGKDGNQICFEGCGKLKCSGCQRTGCVFCGFGSHLEKNKSRFELLKETHPQLYDYCMRGGQYNENGIWIPSNDGLGMKHCIDEINKIYGKNFIKY